MSRPRPCGSPSNAPPPTPVRSGSTSVTPLEIADLGLLTRGEPASGSPAPMVIRAAKASFAMDAGGGAPAVELQPEEIVVTAAVEARFVAR